MTTSAPIRTLRVVGLSSIADLTLDLSSDVTVLVGPNGAGKSNIIAALELLGRIVDGQLQNHVLRSGGFARLLHRATVAAEDADHVSVEGVGPGARRPTSGACCATVIASAVGRPDASR